MDVLERPSECALCGEPFSERDHEANLAEVVNSLGMHMIMHADPCYLSRQNEYQLA